MYLAAVMLRSTLSLFLADVSGKHICLCLLLETEVNVYVSYLRCRTDDDHLLYSHFPTTGILDICHLWILAASWELRTYTNIGYLSFSHRQKPKELLGLFTYQVATFCCKYECLSNTPVV